MNKMTSGNQGESALIPFDYNALDPETAEKLRGITECVAELQGNYAWGMAYQVGKAHDLLCGEEGSCLTVRQLDHKANGNRGDTTFTAWCEHIGISRPTAYNLLNAYNLICKATPEQQTALQTAPAKLLYMAGRRDAPEELVDGVLNQDITTTKEYRDLLAELKDKDEEIERMKVQSEIDEERIEEAEKRAKTAERRADAAEKERDSAGTALNAMRRNADHWKTKAEVLEAQKSGTIEAAMVDEAEVERLADLRAKALAEQIAAPLREELAALQKRPNDRQTFHNAYDAVLLAGRTVEQLWQMLRTQMDELGDAKGQAVDQFVGTLQKICGEAIQCVENR